jgi:hypothetical protein
MALKKIINLTGNRVLQTSFGTVSEGSGTLAIAATIHVIEVAGDKTAVNARVSFTEGAVQFEKIYAVPVSVEDDAPNFIRQAYLHLKTLPEFDNCEDC